MPFLFLCRNKGRRQRLIFQPHTTTYLTSPHHSEMSALQNTSTKVNMTGMLQDVLNSVSKDTDSVPNDADCWMTYASTYASTDFSGPVVPQVRPFDIDVI